jgi:hypothetical protein
MPGPHRSGLLLDPGDVAQRALRGQAIAGLRRFQVHVVAEFAVEVVFAVGHVRVDALPSRRIAEKW